MHFTLMSRAFQQRNKLIGKSYLHTCRHRVEHRSAVFIMAPAKVLHGAVRLHGSVSLPAPETQVRVA